MADRALTVRNLVERYSVTEHTILGWIRSGELKAINVGRKPGAKKPRWRITPEALETFEILRQSEAPPQQKRRRRNHHQNVIEFYK